MVIYFNRNPPNFVMVSLLTLCCALRNGEQVHASVLAARVLILPGVWYNVTHHVWIYTILEYS